MDTVKEGSRVKALSFSKLFFFILAKGWPAVFNQTRSYKTEDTVTDTIRVRAAKITDLTQTLLKIGKVMDIRYPLSDLTVNYG